MTKQEYDQALNSAVIRYYALQCREATAIYVRGCCSYRDRRRMFPGHYQSIPHVAKMYRVKEDDLTAAISNLEEHIKSEEFGFIQYSKVSTILGSTPMNLADYIRMRQDESEEDRHQEGHEAE